MWRQRLAGGFSIRPHNARTPARPWRHEKPLSSNMIRSFGFNCQPSDKRPSIRLVNSDLHIFDSGAESAAALKPRATPWVSESIGAPCKGAGILRPCRAEEVSRTRSRGVAPGWHAPRRWRVIVAEFSSGETCYEAIYEIAAGFGIHLRVARAPTMPEVANHWIRQGGDHFIGNSGIAAGYRPRWQSIAPG